AFIEPCIRKLWRYLNRLIKCFYSDLQFAQNVESIAFFVPYIGEPRIYLECFIISFGSIFVLAPGQERVSYSPPITIFIFGGLLSTHAFSPLRGASTSAHS